MSAPGPEGCNWQGIPGDRRDYARLGACNVYVHERGWVLAQGPQDGDAPCHREHFDGEKTDATRWLIHPWKYHRCTEYAAESPLTQTYRSRYVLGSLAAIEHRSRLASFFSSSLLRSLDLKRRGVADRTTRPAESRSFIRSTGDRGTPAGAITNQHEAPARPPRGARRLSAAPRQRHDDRPGQSPPCHRPRSDAAARARSAERVPRRGTGLDSRASVERRDREIDVM